MICAGLCVLAGVLAAVTIRNETRPAAASQPWHCRLDAPNPRATAAHLPGGEPAAQ